MHAGNADDEVDDFNVDIAVNSSGIYHVVWDMYPDENGESSTMLGSFDSDGVVLSSGVRINDAARILVTEPRIDVRRMILTR